jgi:hypothetical protein
LLCQTPYENSQVLDGLIATIHNSKPADMRGRGSGDPSGRRRSIILGVSLSLLIHAAALWYLVVRPPVVMDAEPPGNERRVTVLLAPPAASPPPPPSAPPSPGVRAGKPPAPRVAKRKPVRKPELAAPQIVTPQPSPRVAEPAASPAPAPSDDMFTQLQAARKRRAEAQGAATPPQEDKVTNDNSVALANIETSLRQANGRNRDDSGGLFQVRRVGLRDATFAFHGWSVNARRNSSRLVTVEQGTEASIEIAVVKKMIEIIREQKTDTFVWESHRLGRNLTLSARPEDSAELQQFLMREFFSAR